MTLCEAHNIIKNKGMTPWMAWGILKTNNGYCICSTQHIKRFPNLDYVYIRKGNGFPDNPSSLASSRINEIIVK